MSLADLFTIRSKEEREEHSRRYERWAFPYGTAQKEKIAQLLGQLMPEEKTPIAMAVYLIGREGYRGSYRDPKDGVERDKRLKKARRLLKKQLPGKLRKKLPTYLALILADAEVGEDLAYPSVDELRTQAEALEQELAQIKD